MRLAGLVRPSSVLVLSAVLTVTAVGAPVVPPSGAPAAAAAQYTAAVGAGCDVQYDNRLLTMLVNRRPHPKVVLGPGDARQAEVLDAAAGPANSHPEGRRVRNQLTLADAALQVPLPSVDGNRSLTARASAERMLRLYFAMQVTEDGYSASLRTPTDVTDESVYARRLVREVDALVALPTWGSTAPLATGQDDLLGTAEIAATVSMGYSLVGHRMTAAQRGATRKALLDKALAPACWGWRNGSWMVDATHNWGVVVNSGMAMAAVVVADSSTTVGAAALTQSLIRANRAIAVSATDGGTPEGPAYAGLLQTYTAYLSATMLNSSGEAGLAKVRGIPHAARYLQSLKGSSGEMFAYADANTGRIIPALPLFNARHGGDPLGDTMAHDLVSIGHAHPLLAFWYRTAGPPVGSRLPLATTFPGSGVATMRSSWAPGSVFVGVKAGSNRANHAHLDLGSFVLDHGGHRFVTDPGQDSYSLPRYFSPPARFDYFRVGTSGHSLLSRPGANQPATASAPMSGILGAAGGGSAVYVDTTQALGARSASRTVTLTGRTTTVQDRVRTSSPTSLRWSVLTPATVRISSNGRVASLQRGTAVVEVRVAGSTPGVLRAAPAPRAPAGGLSNAGLTRLYLDTTTQRGRDGVQAQTITVFLVPR